MLPPEWLKKIQNYFSKRMPEYVQKSLDFYHKDIDPKENNSSRPPFNESIKTHCLWLIEAYPPSYIDNLLSGLEQLDWTSSRRDGKRDHLGWIEEQRKRSGGGGWLNLGYLTGKATASLMPWVRNAPLPSSIKHIRGSVLQFIPSMTLLILQFVLDDHSASYLEKPLTKFHSTFVKPLKTGYTFVSPIHQKSVEIISERKKIYSVCSDWIQTYLPGLFSNGIHEGEFPIVEFTTFEKASPYAAEHRKHDGYMTILGFSHDWDVWQSKDLAGIYLNLPSRSDSDFSKLTICGKLSDILADKDLKGYGDDASERIVNWLKDLDDTFGVWVISVIWEAYERSLGNLRDEVANIQMQNIRKDALKLRNKERKYIELNRDLLSISNELKEFCEAKNFFHHETYDFRPIFKDRGNIELVESIREGLLRRIEQIRDREANLGQVIATCTRLMSALSNEKVISRTFRMQYIMIAMTIAMLILSALNIIVILKTDNAIVRSILDFLSRF